ncbi:MAG: nucleotide-binding protein [Labilithrix sp.]|nr:nucleotide-binding protein [Labilithrix sp.]
MRWQARPNVILEAGMALAIDERRTLLVTLGNVSLSSDIDGRHLVRMNNSASARDFLKRRLEGIGCAVRAASDWLDQGDFDAAVAGLGYDAPGASAAAAVAQARTTSVADAELLLREWALKNSGSHRFADIDAALNLQPGLTSQVIGNLSDAFLVKSGEEMFTIRRLPAMLAI